MGDRAVPLNLRCCLHKARKAPPRRFSPLHATVPPRVQPRRFVPCAQSTQGARFYLLHALVPPRRFSLLHAVDPGCALCLLHTPVPPRASMVVALQFKFLPVQYALCTCTMHCAPVLRSRSVTDEDPSPSNALQDLSVRIRKNVVSAAAAAVAPDGQ